MQENMSRFFSLLLPCRDADTDGIDVPDRLLRGASPQREAWSGHDELDTKLRAKGVLDDPKKKAIRQAQFKVSAAKAALSGEMTVKDLSEELGIKDSTLRRWAREYEEMGDDAFPGNRSPKINEDYEIVKLDESDSRSSSTARPAWWRCSTTPSWSIATSPSTLSLIHI